jgi:hypothetical protein
MLLPLSSNAHTFTVATLEKPWHSVEFLELVPGLDTLRGFDCINI